VITIVARTRRGHISPIEVDEIISIDGRPFHGDSPNADSSGNRDAIMMMLGSLDARLEQCEVLLNLKGEIVREADDETRKG